MNPASSAAANSARGDPGMPRHIGVILDGNRRWARSHHIGTEDTYRPGTAKVPQFLTWCERMGIGIVSLWALSTDNLRRNTAEVTPLLTLIVETLRQIQTEHDWRIRIIGQLELLPNHLAMQLRKID